MIKFIAQFMKFMNNITFKVRVKVKSATDTKIFIYEID